MPLEDIIPTILLYVCSPDSAYIVARAIIDTGSSRNLITKDLATKLRLNKKSCNMAISGLNQSSTICNYQVAATIKSRINGFEKPLDFFIVPSITTLIPDERIDRSHVHIPANIQLADPEFHIPSPVQLLIGAGTTLSSLCVGQINLSSQHNPDLILQKTQFGWVIGGNFFSQPREITNAKCYSVDIQDLSKFWELEESTCLKHLSEEEAKCERHFEAHTIRDTDGRYIIALPFNDRQEQLGESYSLALKRLSSLERRFKRDPVLQNQYTKAINEYIDLGYMGKLNANTSEGFYLPHQAVVKEASMTTKIRVVFDASANTSTGISLNEALLAGPTIQSDIFSLLLRFRLHNYVLTGDIEKMYLQIKVREDDQRYLRILWRDENGVISTYQFNRLIFGLKSASYLAIRCLQQLASDEENNYTRASSILKQDLYVDDLLTGADTLEELVELHKELTELLRLGGFNLRQCASNSSDVLNAIPDQSINLSLHDNKEKTLKTLGVKWNSKQDSIIYTVRTLDQRHITKRSIFSEVAKIFDPLGLLNPVVVTAKLIMQELWKLKIDWDESLPTEIHTRWEVFSSQISDLNDITFHRRTLLINAIEVQLHGFCDASEKAYGACIYFRSTDKFGKTSVQLFCAKSRVAPLKNVQTIPRLELCAASLLSNLYTTVKAAINLKIDKTYFWTDSMIVLHWINAAPHVLKTFVANRIADIQSKTHATDWRHVRTYDNPADILSRGLLPSEFKNASLWPRGPSWLAEAESLWPLQQALKATDLPETRKIPCFITHPVDNSLFLHYSCFTKLQRIIATCLRFRSVYRQTGPLTPEEIKRAHHRIMMLTQKTEFPQEYNALSKGQSIPSRSKLLNLNPFIDENGLIRVGGRLQHSSISYQQKHPIVLPKGNHITELLINQVHLQNLHAGIQSTLYTLRRQYWPLDGRNQVRKIIRRCVRCARVKPTPVEYVMGSLPKVRTSMARPFANVGIDYCGPFFIKERRHRNRTKLKVYVVVFICLAIKATHLEVASDMSTEGFLAALKRFISRRGRCTTIYSDNGTNFVGANNELKELQTLLTSHEHNQKVQNFLTDKGIIWHFNPPQAPHYGGIWEAAVKSFKHHLRRVVGNELLTYEQLNTLVIEIEAVLNSRPLTPLSSDPNDFTALTPAHFLIGDIFSSLPEQDFSHTSSNRLSIWQHIQKIKRDFWTRWYKEYINELNIRHKWRKGTHDIKIGSIVLIRDDNLPPLQWRLGRVLQTHAGQDGVVRTVQLRTATGELHRCVRKLALLPVDGDPPSSHKDIKLS